jgi:beta-glucanase (GH16 family)
MNESDAVRAARRSDRGSDPGQRCNFHGNRQDVKRDPIASFTVHPVLAAALCAGLAAGCAAGPRTSDERDPAPSGKAASALAQRPTVWAVNVGGPAVRGVDGTRYEAETSVDGGRLGTMSVVKGSQDAQLYKTYRAGDVRIARPIPNGTYDVTFHFAEPEDVPGGARVFDAFVEEKRVIDDLDVMAARDGKIHSALTVTVADVSVSDGELDVRFEAAAKEPVLSALVVRTPLEPSGGWKLVWSDEFEGDALDPDKWGVREWPPKKVNDEDQAYTSRPKNLRIEDGHLVIEAHQEAYEGAKYTSGRIYSHREGVFLYGRFEIRARLPRGKGTWPAIWMLPESPFQYATKCKPGDVWQGSSTCDAWPNSGEIDIMEHVGYQMGHVHGTVHNEAYYWAKWEQRKGRMLQPDVADAFHVYALEWTPDRIDVFVDDTLYFTYVNEKTGWRSWPYDHPFSLILNVAVGGAWGRAGGGIDDAIFPQRMLVDYVRVYANE